MADVQKNTLMQFAQTPRPTTIRIFRCAKAYQDDHVKIRIAFADTVAHTALLAIIEEIMVKPCNASI